MSKKTYKKSRLPSELFTNRKLDKRGKGELKKRIEVRLSIGEHSEMMEVLNSLDINQSNFIRYAIKLGMEDIANRLDNEG